MLASAPLRLSQRLRTATGYGHAIAHRARDAAAIPSPNGGLDHTYLDIWGFPGERREMSTSAGTVFLGLTRPDHGDQRLNDRQVSILAAFASSAREGMSAPSALGSSAATEAYYRFLRNDRISTDAIIAPHMKEAFGQATRGRLLVAHDTTDIRHATAEDAPDVYSLGGGLKGYRVHASLLIDEQHAAPIGIGHLEVISRPSEKGPESERWQRGVEAVAARTSDREQVVHICDSEGDAYPFMARICGLGQDFIIRECQDRVVDTDGHGTGQIMAISEELPVMGQFTVEVPKRKRTRSRPKEKKRTERSARTAILDVRFGAIRVKRPAKRSKENLPAELSLWYVYAKEADPPENEDPIEWRLWLTLPVTSLEEAVEALCLYKMRWRIEELFNALKNGCGFAKSRFESRSTSEASLALHLPIAVGLLRLRALGELGEDLAAVEVVDETQLQILRTLDKKLPSNPTAADVMWSVARLGGYLPQNQRAGWLVLGRGLSKLLTMSVAWKLARGQPLSILEQATVGDVIN